MNKKPNFQKERKSSSDPFHRKELPVYQCKAQILEQIQKNQFTVIVGETGSGKTTQVPQYLNESRRYTYHFSTSASSSAKSSDSNISTQNRMMIAVVQPRRVAATSVARRVSQEMNCSVGSYVGYSVRFDEKYIKGLTAIKYVTSGMLLREALLDPMLSNYSVIILDEAHERSAQFDILLGLIKNIAIKRPLPKNVYDPMEDQKLSPHPLRVVVMSATLEAEKFGCYLFNANIMLIKGRQHPVNIYYTATPQTDYINSAVTAVLQLHEDKKMPFDDAKREREAKLQAESIKREADKTEGKDKKEEKEEKEEKSEIEPRRSGDIIVFLTGQEEIETAAQLLKERLLDTLDSMEEKDNKEAKESSSSTSSSSSSAAGGGGTSSPSSSSSSSVVYTRRPLEILPLYAMLPFEEQQKVFQPPSFKDVYPELCFGSNSGLNSASSSSSAITSQSSLSSSTSSSSSSSPNTTSTSSLTSTVPRNVRRVILSTNIAEASVTVPGVSYVIDSGLAKINMFVASARMDTLQVLPISRDSARQRAGRAGREGKGECYRLFTEDTFWREMKEHTLAEIFRISLAALVLQMKAYGIRDVKAFDFIEHPSDKELDRAEAQLIQLGAIREESEEERILYSVKDKAQSHSFKQESVAESTRESRCTVITRPLGSSMAVLPVHPQHAKALLISPLFGCTREILNIISMMNVDNVFLPPRFGNNQNESSGGDGASDGKGGKGGKGRETGFSRFLDENFARRFGFGTQKNQRNQLNQSSSNTDSDHRGGTNKQNEEMIASDHLLLSHILESFMASASRSAKWCTMRGLSKRGLDQAVRIRDQLVGYLGQVERKIAEEMEGEKGEKGEEEWEEEEEDYDDDYEDANNDDDEISGERNKASSKSKIHSSHSSSSMHRLSNSAGLYTLKDDVFPLPSSELSDYPNASSLFVPSRPRYERVVLCLLSAMNANVATKQGGMRNSYKTPLCDSAISIHPTSSLIAVAQMKEKAERREKWLRERMARKGEQWDEREEDVAVAHSIPSVGVTTVSSTAEVQSGYPQCIFFNELLATSKIYLRTCSAIDPVWLDEVRGVDFGVLLKMAMKKKGRWGK
ncbi:putative ATP-dependent RNA helicase [Monocercomonoides exilis]|uniref:putative ATP-dependent RNA helicase n=1 Tax=Monocercomonoides exilis TaxID=2049356 RepID=UPI00355A9AFC|nr:putative ATP-dependent RNA helicase [Monocercomonoides exilis]|eukprot:MONOS_4835.1-p1 / transcript=MONOS_4835.1 / gene=MONOS_4835 / organism=Monocercomonoides_exilis_PA203 / gene_product=ATP-dependent RNA helicase, putative / transcript_product=ATP-dependent RNA helicase, putative / location=Mono_scaffold00134:80572-83928(-) / protein_length=1089 / sequence_SO=supercontig / SO=protein_coding / is_pseudo=false